MAVIRSFIAVELPKPIQDSLEQVILSLQAKTTNSVVRWVPARNIHLTLKFFGEVSSGNLEILVKILQTEIMRHRCFELRVSGLGAFPSIHRPRVIWVGVEAPNDLMILQRSIESETIRLGYTEEERPFSAHLTLGRISHNATPDEVRDIGLVLSETHVGPIGATRVDKVKLFRSDLEPGGAVYTPLYTIPLTH
jgi:2'-5' RNA ligase